MRGTFKRRAPAAIAGVFALVGGMAAGTGAAAAAPGVSWQLFVSPRGSTASPDFSCRTAAYDTIGAAVAAAPGGSTITVCPGTYDESVTVTGKSLRLISQGATISVPDTASSEGVVFMGPMTAGSSLQGFTITGGQAEGFYADGTSDLTISGNRIIGNDLSCQNATDAALGDDCGEGLHLDAVTNSRIIGNYIAGNTGGILMTDGIPPGSIGATAFAYTTQYSGPSSGNLIADNRTIDNLWACGITLPRTTLSPPARSPGCRTRRQAASTTTRSSTTSRPGTPPRPAAAAGPAS
jgi:Right handed beta helix region